MAGRPGLPGASHDRPLLPAARALVQASSARRRTIMSKRRAADAETNRKSFRRSVWTSCAGRRTRRARRANLTGAAGLRRPMRKLGIAEESRCEARRAAVADNECARSRTSPVVGVNWEFTDRAPGNRMLQPLPDVRRESVGERPRVGLCERYAFSSPAMVDWISDRPEGS